MSLGYLARIGAPHGHGGGGGHPHHGGHGGGWGPVYSGGGYSVPYAVEVPVCYETRRDGRGVAVQVQVPCPVPTVLGLSGLGAMCNPYAPPSAGQQTGCTPYVAPPQAGALPGSSSGWLLPVALVAGGVVLYKLMKGG